MAHVNSGTFQFTDIDGNPVGDLITGNDAVQAHQAYAAFLRGEGFRGFNYHNATTGVTTYINMDGNCVCGGVWTPSQTTVADPDCEEPTCE